MANLRHLHVEAAFMRSIAGVWGFSLGTAVSGLDPWGSRLGTSIAGLPSPDARLGNPFANLRPSANIGAATRGDEHRHGARSSCISPHAESADLAKTWPQPPTHKLRGITSRRLQWTAHGTCAAVAHRTQVQGACANDWRSHARVRALGDARGGRASTSSAMFGWRASTIWAMLGWCASTTWAMFGVVRIDHLSDVRVVRIDHLADVLVVDIDQRGVGYRKKHCPKLGPLRGLKKCVGHALRTVCCSVS